VDVVVADSDVGCTVVVSGVVVLLKKRQPFRLIHSDRLVMHQVNLFTSFIEATPVL
jgi:hypothetical protein